MLKNNVMIKKCSAIFRYDGRTAATDLKTRDFHILKQFCKTQMIKEKLA